MTKKSLIVMLIGICMVAGTALTRQDARADMTGPWAVDINWVPLVIDACFNYTVSPPVGPGLHPTDLGGAGGWLLELNPTVLVQGNVNFPQLLYVALNRPNPEDEAVGGYQQNLDVPNWGSHHMVRGSCPLAASGADNAATGE